MSRVLSLPKKPQTILFVVILLTAAFLRFYNLGWGQGFFFHPDEGNIARSVSQMRPENGFHPNFFAYGQFPLYLSYTVGVVINAFFKLLPASLSLPDELLSQSVWSVRFEHAVYLLRMISAAASTATVWVIYKIVGQLQKGRKHGSHLITNIAPLVSAALVAFTPGLIQAAHFGTTESLLTFFLALTTYQALKIALLERRGQSVTQTLLLTGVILGCAIATKIIALLFFLPVFIATVIFAHRTSDEKLRLYKIITIYLSVVFVAGTALITAFITSPYTLLDIKGFSGSMAYEGPVATGDIKVFYTRSFEDTLPVLFQMEKIFPYALGWPLYVFGVIGLFYNLYLIFKDKNMRASGIILFSAFIGYGLPNLFLFAKWVRFLVPVMPFFAIFAGIAADNFLHLNRFRKTLYHSVPTLRRDSVRYTKNFVNSMQRGISTTSVVVLLLFSIIPGIIFFGIYARPDSRIQASAWIYKHIPDESYILSETANVVDIPIFEVASRQSLVASRYTVISFDFYHVDQDSFLQPQLLEHLTKADYILIPSRRIFANHLRLPGQYPIVNRYYSSLFDGTLGFEPVSMITSDGMYACRPLHLNGSESVYFQGIENALVNNNQRTKTFGAFSLSELDFSLKLKRWFERATLKINGEQSVDCLQLYKDEAAEETFTVFDHPVIRVFRKTTAKTIDEYGKILGISDL